LKVEAAAALVPGSNDRPPDAPLPINPEKTTVPLKPTDAWREELIRLQGVARDGAAGSDEFTRELWSFRVRVLDGLAATEPTGRWVRAAAEQLDEIGPFEITELRLCRKVKGFGDYEPLEPGSCRAGHGVIIYSEMAGVGHQGEGPLFHSRIASRVEILAAGGNDPLWTQPLGTADDYCRRRRRDFCVNYRITLPDTLAPGAYQLRLLQEDLVTNRSVTRAVPLAIVP
jgi:hypothetical protein